MPALSFPFSIVAGDIPIANRVQSNFNAIQTLLNTTKLAGDNLQNGIITPAMLTTALQDTLGVNGAVTHRGSSIIAAEGTRTNTAFGALSNGPDQVASVVVPTGGIMRVLYHALWKGSSVDAKQAAIFIGANQYKTPVTGVGTVVEAAYSTNDGATGYEELLSANVGLVDEPVASASVPGTTGEGLGVVNSGFPSQLIISNATVKQEEVAEGVCVIHGLAAGTYTVSVQFKCAGTGTVLAKNRELYVEVQGY
jgi:hypothetical protein